MKVQKQLSGGARGLRILGGIFFAALAVWGLAQNPDENGLAGAALFGGLAVLSLITGLRGYDQM